MLIKVSAADEKVVLDVTALSAFTATELKESQIVMDVATTNHSNLYRIGSVRDQNIVITLTIF